MSAPALLGWCIADEARSYVEAPRVPVRRPV